MEPLDPHCQEFRGTGRTTWIAQPAEAGPFPSPRVAIPSLPSTRAKQLRVALSDTFEVTPQGDGLLLVAKHPASAALTPDGAFLITQDREARIEVHGLASPARWHIDPWLETWHSNVGGAPGRLAVLVPPAGDSLFVSCSADAGLEPLNGEKLVERATGKARAVIGPHRFVWDLAYSPDGEKVLLVYEDVSRRESVLLIDAQDGRLVPLELRGRLRFTSDGGVVRDGGCPD